MAFGTARGYPLWCAHLLMGLLLALEVVNHLALGAVAAAATTAPSIVFSFSDLAAENPVPSPEPPTTKPVLFNDMQKLLHKIGSLPCREDTRSRMYSLLYGSNTALRDQCIADSAYQFFPYTGKLPSTEQIAAIVTSTACMQLYSGVVLADFPECDIDFVSVRSSAETYLRIKSDVDAQRAPPTKEQFYELYSLNRVVNLLRVNASLIEAALQASPAPAAAVSLAELVRVTQEVEPLRGVALGPDMTVSTTEVSTTGSHGAMDGSSEAASGLMDDDIVSSDSGSSSDDGSSPPPAKVPAPSPTPGASSSPIQRPSRSSTSSAARIVVRSHWAVVAACIGGGAVVVAGQAP